MDNEFPDSDEEYELLHQEELESLHNVKAQSVNTKQLKQTEDQSNFPSTSSTNTKPQCTSNVNTFNVLNCKPSTSKDLDIQYIINVGIKEKPLPEPEKTEPKKRTYDELFGDITDLLGTDTFPEIHEPQEKRPRWNEPDEIIKRVLGARHLLHCQETSSSRREHVQEIQKDSISLRVPPWNFVALTRSTDSQRIYIRVRNKKSNVRDTKSISNLLSVPYRLLKEQAQDIMVKNVEHYTSVTNDAATSEESKEDELWVDKYRPKSYVELLSDENVNRQFLHWLKLWDKVVFNRDPIVSTKKKPTTVQGNKKFENTNFQELDSKGIPVHKVALLSGPPGLGKTTLAHIAAKHAGYNIVEINASDERGPDAFRQVLLAATQMRSVMGADPKPNCLILDEIDGAPVASIDILLKFVQGKLFGRGKKNKDKNEKQQNTCHRPVICICNEPYTPSLRPLRAVALIVPVPEVTASRLVDRLMEIARKESLIVNPDALLTLVQRSGCDVRSCLGALQYMGSSDLGENTSLGLKDTRKGLFDSWREILMVPMNKTVPVPFPERVRNILHIIQSGETERLAQGVFHNYLTVCNEKLQNISLSLEWFQYFDNILNIVMSQQIWSLMPYTNYSFVTWHLYLSKAQNPKLSYPTAMYEANQKLAKSNSILTAIQQSSGRDVLTLVTDFAPFLPDILTPRLRTVSGHLFSTKERSDLENLVNILLDFGLSYVQEKNADGGYEYKLDPDILGIGIFPGVKTRRTLTYAVKQIIAQELETERLRRVSNTKGVKDNNLPNGETKTSKPQDSKESSSAVDAKKSKPEEIKQNTPPEVPNHLQKLEINTIQPKDTVFKDFFGRVITSAQQNEKNEKIQRESLQKTSPRGERVSHRVRDILKNHGVWYKYKEGFSNAVRRTVLMGDLL